MRPTTCGVRSCGSERAFIGGVTGVWHHERRSSRPGSSIRVVSPCFAWTLLLPCCDCSRGRPRDSSSNLIPLSRRWPTSNRRPTRCGVRCSVLFALDSASTVWFTMAPEAASLVALTGDGPAVHTGIVLTARPRVVIGARPPTDGRILPPLTLVGRSSGIHVPLEIEVPFDDLSKRATALLAGEVAGQGITVGDVLVWGVGDTAIVKVNVRGRISGALYLLGRVGYDVPSRSVSIGDLRFTLESTSKMSSIKATLGAARIRRALSDATGHGRLAIGDSTRQAAGSAYPANQPRAGTGIDAVRRRL